MEELTITELTRLYDVTPRMLRHYEKLGLLQSKRREDYAYRVYDGEAVRRLQQIVILRKLRFSLKQIEAVLRDEDGARALQILRDNIAALEDELSALEKLRRLLTGFLRRLEKNGGSFPARLLDDAALGEAARGLILSKTLLKESMSMEDLDKAERVLNGPPSVRLLRLPPYTVASYQYVGEDPEEHAGDVVSRFVQESGLYGAKPDSRMFGFNHPNPGVLEGGIHGYEVWVTVPEDWEVPAPLEKKRFPGGVYAAMAIKFGDFHLWENLLRWAEESPDYAPDLSPLGFEIMGGCLEEHLDWVYASHRGWPEDGLPGQLDLLLPVKKR